MIIIRLFDFGTKPGFILVLLRGERLQVHVRFEESFAKHYLYKKRAPSLVGMVHAFLVVVDGWWTDVTWFLVLL